MKSRRGKKKRYILAKFDPYLTFLVFVVVGLGTLRIGGEARLFILWLVLLGVCLIYAEEKAIAMQYGLVNLGRGAVVGLVISLPLLLLAQDALQSTSTRLFPWASHAALFQNVVLLAAPIEGLYFRGFLQRERGLVGAALLYGLGQGLLFLPGLIGFPVVLAAGVVAAALLGFVYGYVCQRYGLSASISCHVTVNLVLLFLPLAFGEWFRAI
ncbi:MAG: CPBP family intramembrane metalloprotease [Chloroflexi bacterium]|nr:CPBP family intramembrane metalloprotease [Chloroflexota bacterium]